MRKLGVLLLILLGVFILSSCSERPKAVEDNSIPQATDGDYSIIPENVESDPYNLYQWVFAIEGKAYDAFEKLVIDNEEEISGLALNQSKTFENEFGTASLTVKRIADSDSDQNVLGNIEYFDYCFSLNNFVATIEDNSSMQYPTETFTYWLKPTKKINSGNHFKGFEFTIRDSKGHVAKFVCVDADNLEYSLNGLTIVKP